MIASSNFFSTAAGGHGHLSRSLLSLGQTHLPASAAAAVVVVFLIAGIWYWRRLGRASVLLARRRLRRMSLLLAGVVVVSTAAATGWIDPEVQPVTYLFAWVAVIITLFILVLTALFDTLVSVRVHQEIVDRRVVRGAIRLREAIERSNMNEGDDARAARAARDASKEPPNA